MIPLEVTRSSPQAWDGCHNLYRGRYLFNLCLDRNYAALSQQKRRHQGRLGD